MSEFIKSLKGMFESRIDDQAGIDLKSWMEQCDHTIAESTENILSVVGEVEFPEIQFRKSFEQAVFPYTERCVSLMLNYILLRVDEDSSMEILVERLCQCAGAEPFDKLLADTLVQEEAPVESELDKLKEKYSDLVKAGVPKEKEDGEGLPPSPQKCTAKPIKRITRETP